MSELLPDSWEAPLLEEIAKVTSGIGFPKDYQGLAEGDLGFFKVGDISKAVRNHHGHLIQAEHYVSFETARYLKGNPIAKGSTVFAKIGEAIRLNRRAFVDRPCLIDNNVMAVKADIEEVDRYLYHFLRIIDFGPQSRSSTVPSLRKGDAENLSVPFPPLKEQKRITDKLDALLKRVDTCREKLDRIPFIFKRFRQAVLAAATSGALTEDWREQKGLSCWETVNIQHVASKIFDGPFGSHLKSEDYTQTGIRVARLENIGWLQFFSEKETYISPEKFRLLEKHTLKAQDILFSSFVSEEVRVCLVPSEHSDRIINKADCFCIRADTNICAPAFLAMRLACRSTFKIFESKVHGATRPRINLGQLKAFTFTLPSTTEQLEIVRRVEKLFAFADHMEARYTTARKQVDQLTPSLLAKAFRGELVEQDPNDEPAAVLLERIKAERAGQGATKQTRGRKPKTAE